MNSNISTLFTIQLAVLLLPFEAGQVSVVSLLKNNLFFSLWITSPMDFHKISDLTEDVNNNNAIETKTL
jgi:hypothetical protein